MDPAGTGMGWGAAAAVGGFVLTTQLSGLGVAWQPCLGTRCEGSCALGSSDPSTTADLSLLTNSEPGFLGLSELDSLGGIGVLHFPMA